MHKLKKRDIYKAIAKTLVFTMAITMLPLINLPTFAATDDNTLSNQYFNVKIGDYGEINSLKLANDEFDTNYVLNGTNAPTQGASDEHQWMGELMFQTKKEGDSNWTQSMTSASQKDSKARTITKEGNKVTVTYKNESADKGIKDFQLVETYELVDNHLKWSMKVTNPDPSKTLTVGDLGLPMPFNEYFTPQYNNELFYETRVVYHSFASQDSSYIYATRPSGQGRFLLFEPDVSTGAKLEYQDHWRTNNGHSGSVWAQDQGGWSNGLNVFYIHSNVIKQTGSSYLQNTELSLKPGESKEYSFNFSPVQNEKSMKSELYNNGIIDSVAVPGMAFAKNMPAKFYLHTKYDYDNGAANSNITNVEVKCSHDTKLYEGLQNSVSNKQPCTKNEGTSVTYEKTETVDGEKYHVFDLKLTDLGANYVLVHYLDDSGQEKVTTLQFYAMDKAEDALNLHANFVTNNTQIDDPNKIEDRIFDDWMMDTKKPRGVYSGYMGWGDDWGFTHGEYLAEKNVYLPVKKQIEAVDNYLDTAIWNGIMREHHEDYKVNDWLDNEPNNTGQGTTRGYAYPHVYNTYFSMYKVASKYPDMVTYKEKKETYLLRAYNILKALYGDGVGYNWDTGLMGESTTPDIIAALDKEGYYKEAQNIRDIMAKKYDSFKNQKYPYGSEYSYDNTGEEAVYTLAKLENNSDMMKKIDEKTRACRGLQPIWYHYANPTTICGENWWNFQYSASLIGYCMDDWLRLQDNSMDNADRALASRVNYAAKLANLTAINSGQIDDDSANIGSVAWTYQSELGNNGAQGTGGGKIHNGWRQMSGEADTGLFGAMHILSSDVATDPVFGLFGYGCDVKDNGDSYEVTPLDGLYTRLNFMDEKLYVNLDRDQYYKAVVSKNSDSVELSMKNLEKTVHNTDIKLTGLKAGNYDVVVNGSKTGSFKSDGALVTTTVPMPADETADVVIQKGSSSIDDKLTVNAGEDQSVELSKGTRLEGAANSNTSGDKNLTCKWSVESAPEGANPQIENPDKLISNIKFDKTGEYVFDLNVSHGENNSSDSVKITVTEDTPLPETLASYTFDNLNSDKSNREEYRKLLSADSEGKGYTSQVVSNPVFTGGKQGQALSLSGAYCGYVRLCDEMTKRVDEATISADIKLSSNQGSNARIFEFRDTDGKTLYASVINGNEIAMGATDASTKKVTEVSSKINVGIGYWKNVAITIGKDSVKNTNTAILYVDGVKAGEIDNIIKLSDLGDIQRNFIGRGDNKAGVFFNGLIDNFTMKSKAMTSDEISAAYGNTAGSTPVSAEASDIITKVGEAPVLPTQVKVLYSNGIYKMENVVWDSIEPSSYSKVGTFIVEGTVTGVTGKAKMTVHVVSGDPQNIAGIGTPSAIINSVNDLGGVKGLNDGYDPKNSKDTSHGVWHNWNGDQGGPAWVEYDFDKSVVLTESDAYYFKDSGGNFLPASVEYEYKNENGDWQKFDNETGLGVEINKYNKTTFNPVVTKAIRMNMTPATLGCGVIEWQVYGYSSQDVVNKKTLTAAITTGKGIKEKLTESGYSDLTAALTEANSVVNDATVSQEAVDKAAEEIMKAIDNLKPKDNNIAYIADVSTSYVSSWETLGAVNDGIEGANSGVSGIPHYGSWGNASAYETVTYEWLTPKDITSTEIYFWNDGGGILTPKACKYEYEDKDGNWIEVPNPNGLGVELNKYNVTTFDKISTKGLRVTMSKAVEDSNGIGVVEWKVTGEKAAQTVDKSELQKLYDAHKTDTQGQNKDDVWSGFIKALDNAKAVIDNAAATQTEVDTAKEELQGAIAKLNGSTDSDLINLARIPSTTSSAVINSVEDLGGVAGLNDGYDPVSSGDTSHGIWHNWNGDQKGTAWVEYDFDKPYMLKEADAYYFKDNNGNFAPASVKYEYKDENGEWKDFENVNGLGVELNKYNKTTFTPVKAIGIRMTMKPLTLGCGVIEWQVYGYEDKDNPGSDVNKDSLKELYETYKEKTKGNYTEESWEAFIEALDSAHAILKKEDATQTEVDEAKSNLKAAINALTENSSPTTGPAVEANKSALQELYDAHKDDTKGNYTSVSWNNFVQALDNALKILGNAEAKQKDVDDALSGLKLAIDDRRKISSHSSSKSKNETDTTSVIPPNTSDSVNPVEKALVDNLAKTIGAEIKGVENITTKNGGNAIAATIAINGNTAEIVVSNKSDTVEVKANENTKAYIFVKELNAYKEIVAKIENGKIVFTAQAETPYLIGDKVLAGNVIHDGWNKINGFWYWVNQNGSLKTSWYKENGIWYHLSKDGKMDIKWFKDSDGNWYFLNDSGAMETGWLQDTNDKWYYLKANGAMAYNEDIDGYHLDENGEWVE